MLTLAKCSARRTSWFCFATASLLCSSRLLARTLQHNNTITQGLCHLQRFLTSFIRINLQNLDWAWQKFYWSNIRQRWQFIRPPNSKQNNPTQHDNRSSTSNKLPNNLDTTMELVTRLKQPLNSQTALKKHQKKHRVQDHSEHPLNSQKYPWNTLSTLHTLILPLMHLCSTLKIHFLGGLCS